MGAPVGDSSVRSGNLATLSSLLKAFFGVGALSLPYAWMQAGVLSSTIMLVILAMVALYAIFKLVEAADLIMLIEARRNMVTRIRRQANPECPRAELFERLPFIGDDHLQPEDWEGIETPTYAQVGNAAYGIYGGRIVDLLMVICQFGICIAYIVFISDNFHDVFTSIDRRLWIAIFFLPLLALANISNLSKLAPVASMGNIVYFVTIAIIFYVGITQFCCIDRGDIVWNDFALWPSVFGICSFSLEGIALVVPIKSKMLHRSKFPLLMSITMSSVFVLYASIALGGYLLYGTHTKSPILAALPQGVTSDIARIALSLSIFFSFPFQIYPIAEFFDRKIARRNRIDPVSVQAYKDAGLMNQSGELVVDEAELYSRAGNDDNDHTSPDRQTTTTTTENVLSSPKSHATSLNDATNSPTLPSSPSTVNISNALLVNQRPEFALLPRHEQITSINQAYKRQARAKVIVRLTALAVISTIGIVFPDFHLIVTLFGGLANSSLAFILPALFWISIVSNKKLYGKDIFFYDRHGCAIDVPTIVLTTARQHKSYYAQKKAHIDAGNDSVPGYGATTPPHKDKHGIPNTLSPSLPSGTAAIDIHYYDLDPSSCQDIPSDTDDDASNETIALQQSTSRSRILPKSHKGEVNSDDDISINGKSPLQTRHDTPSEETKDRMVSPHSSAKKGDVPPGLATPHLENMDDNAVMTQDIRREKLERHLERTVKKRRWSFDYLVKTILIPSAVAVMGIFASAIAVTDAIKDIVEKL